jgi:hypothetical protein
MKNVMCGGFVAAVLAVSAVAGAQGQKMDDKMASMKPETSYTGCVERSPNGAFTLGHAMASSTTKEKSMATDSMADDSMAKESMAHDSMMKDAMSSTLTLASTSIDLARHVGHKVTVKGVAGDTMEGVTTFDVKSIKTVKSSCS